jgi:hypothetical protein
MIAFTVIVGDEFGLHPAQVAFTGWDHAVQAFLLNRADKPLRVGIAVRRPERCLHDSNASRLEEVLNGDTPLPISVADQDGTRAEYCRNRMTNISSVYGVDSSTRTRRV